MKVSVYYTEGRSPHHLEGKDVRVEVRPSVFVMDVSVKPRVDAIVTVDGVKNEFPGVVAFEVME